MIKYMEKTLIITSPKMICKKKRQCILEETTINIKTKQKENFKLVR